MAKHRKIKRYSHSYRARRRRQQNVLRVLLFLLILAALALVGYSIAMSLERLSNPSSEESSGISSSEISSETSSEVSSEPESSEPSSEAEPEPVEDKDIRAIAMPLETMLSDTGRAAFLQGIDTDLYNTVVLPLKDQNGRVWYQTGISHAAACGALTENAVDAAALLAEIEACQLDAAAMIWSLQDDYASHAIYGTSYMFQNDPNVTWLDNSADMGGKSWLNPYLPAAQEYLTLMTAELSEIGFEEIFVFGHQYPTTANQWGMGMGSQNGVSQADALENLIALMQESAGDSRIIPAYMGDCYTEGVRPHIYTVSPNQFDHVPSAPILGTEMALLDNVTAAAETLVPVISDPALTASLAERGIGQYLVR